MLSKKAEQEWKEDRELDKRYTEAKINFYAISALTSLSLFVYLVYKMIVGC